MRRYLFQPKPKKRFRLSLTNINVLRILLRSKLSVKYLWTWRNIKWLSLFWPIDDIRYALNRLMMSVYLGWTPLQCYNQYFNMFGIFKFALDYLLMGERRKCMTNWFRNTNLSDIHGGAILPLGTRQTTIRLKYFNQHFYRIMWYVWVKCGTGESTPLQAKQTEVKQP